MATSACITTRHLAAIPLEGAGHINPMMNLCRLLAEKNKDNLLISFVIPEERLGLLEGSEPLPPNIQVKSVDYPIPKIGSRARGPELKIYHEAVIKMGDAVETVVVEMEPKVDYIIGDSFLPWVSKIGKKLSVPVGCLWVLPPSLYLAFYRFAQLDAKGQLPADLLDGKDEALAFIPKVMVPKSAGVETPFRDILRAFYRGIAWMPEAQNLIFTSPHELESDAIDTLRSELSIPVYPLGPLIPYMALNSPDTNNKTASSAYSKWLDSKPNNSVLYIAFGSFHSACGPQIEELIEGLKASGVPFLLATREPNEKLKGLDEEVGMVVPWCEQLRVLCHPCVGGFVTHCGRSSTLEGVYAGVPMLTFPFVMDQYTNSKLIVEVWGIGLSLKDESEEERVIGRDEVAAVVKKLMDLDGEESKGIRARSAEVMGKCREAIGEGGSSSVNLDALVQDIYGTNIVKTEGEARDAMGP